MKKQFLIPLVLWGVVVILGLAYFGVKELLKDSPRIEEIPSINTGQVYTKLENPTFLREWESSFGKVNAYQWGQRFDGCWTILDENREFKTPGCLITLYFRKHSLEKAVEIQGEAPEVSKRVQPSKRQENLKDKQKLIEYDWEPFTVLPDNYIQDTYLVCGLGDKEECDWWNYSGRYGQYIVVLTYSGFQAGISLDEFETIYSEIDRAIALTFQEAGAFEE